MSAKRPLTSKSTPPSGAVRAGGRPHDARRRRRRRLLARLAVAAVAVLGLLFLVSRVGGGKGGHTSRFAVGQPGPGQQAPPIQLPSTAGATFDLAAERGKSVLLYFQEGIGCQPCWDQIRDLEKQMADVRAMGVDELVSIAGNPLPQLRQKAADEQITTPVLADPDLSLGSSYGANHFGMMGTSAYGHTFILVGKDGTIRWRADYGGAPNYTMYVRLPALLDDLRAGIGRAPG